MSLDCWWNGWSNRVNGAKPLNEIGHADASESYEVDLIHVFYLDNGQYALVTESGCSCYEYEQADLDLYPTLNAAFDKYIAYKKEHSLEFTNLEFLEMKSQEKENESHSKNLNPKAS